MRVGEEGGKLRGLTCWKDDDREQLESIGTISYLKRQNIWLEPEFIGSLNRIESLTEEIINVLESWEAEISHNKDRSRLKSKKELYKRLTNEGIRIEKSTSKSEINIKFKEDKEFWNRLKHEMDDEAKEKLEKNAEKMLEESLKNKNKKMRRKIEELSDEAASTLVEFNNNHDEELDILQNRVLYLCPECGSFLSSDTFEPEECYCGNEISSHAGSEKFHFKQLKDPVLKLSDENVPLEYATERILSKMQSFKADSGIYVRGSSGVGHEFDVVAENREEGFRVLCECKTVDITLNEIMKFNQKCEDVGTVYKIFSSTGNAQPGVRKFARKHNILLLENFWEESSLEEIDEQIKDYLK